MGKNLGRRRSDKYLVEVVLIQTNVATTLLKCVAHLDK